MIKEKQASADLRSKVGELEQSQLQMAALAKEEVEAAEAAASEAEKRTAAAEEAAAGEAAADDAELMIQEGIQEGTEHREKRRKLDQE